MGAHTSKTRGGYDKALYQSPIYRSWFNMKTRCLNPKSPEYKNYGSRGITVCGSWLTFVGFLKDMGNTYRSGLTIERINNHGIYCKENCRWATPKEQANNTRNTERAAKFQFQGKEMRISEIAKIVGLKRKTLAMRLQHYKMPFEVAIKNNLS